MTSERYGVGAASMNRRYFKGKPGLIVGADLRVRPDLRADRRADTQVRPCIGSELLDDPIAEPPDDLCADDAQKRGRDDVADPVGVLQDAFESDKRCDRVE